MRRQSLKDQKYKLTSLEINHRDLRKRLFRMEMDDAARPSVEVRLFRAAKAIRLTKREIAEMETEEGAGT